MAPSPPTDGATVPQVSEARETAATTTGLIVAYVRQQGGDDAVASLLASAGVPFAATELADRARWFSYDTRIRLFEAATGVLDDPDTAHKIGAAALRNNLAPAIVLLLRALGSPRQVYRQLPSAVTKFSTTSTMELLHLGRRDATLRFELHEGYRHSRLDCAYARGLIATVPELFSLPPARVDHPACESDGHEACIYEVSWQSRQRLRRRRRPVDDPEVRALRAQLEELQSAASDLVGTDELDVALARITERAASAVVAPAYLLAVRQPGSDEPLVHSAGLEPADAVETARRLLDGEDLGDHAVVVDVATARRTYGRLAAIYGPRQHGLQDEASLLAAYAAHAAAALELLLSLEASRRGEARARDLLALAHRLSTTETEQDVADVVVAAVPTIVGAPRTAMLAWDAGSGLLSTLAAQGLTAPERSALFSTSLRPDETAELARMLTRREPTVLRIHDASAALKALLHVVKADRVVAMPLIAGDGLLGVLTANHGLAPPATWPDEEAIERLRGIADQAASAMQNARLLDKVRHQAHHDGLTGLPNRLLFMQTLDRRISAGGDDQIAVLFCDLDGFKQINDHHGHGAGDELLRQVAARLRAVLRPGDLVARLSGDEFALVLRGRSIGSVAGEIADRITDQFSAPFRVDGRELRVSTSVGVAVQGQDDDADRLLGRADTAMYVAKQRGRNQVVLADGVPRAAGGSRSSAAEVRTGLEQDAFELHYQPIVKVGGAPDGAHHVEVLGYEALARWRHPHLGLLTPAAFLPLAEESGDIVALDLWAIRAATAAAATWGGTGDPLHVAVNLAAQTLIDPRLVPAVRAALNGVDLDPARLTIEVIESRALVDLPGVVEQLTELRRLGVRIALDDFGTGYSTLSWLQRLPIDQIKLDRTFLTALSDDADAGALVEGVLALARSLGIEVVAEGVETDRQLRALATAGCELVQGYLFGRPARRDVDGTVGRG
ncbi:MAG: EAL domain-containing protein [Actinobacteria bacterium]|jgi:diguanylate cyclase (GGDEF)-like protein|nr:EAL domain-containing protein [Actinomycetota bacterium]